MALDFPRLRLRCQLGLAWDNYDMAPDSASGDPAWDNEIWQLTFLANIGKKRDTAPDLGKALSVP